MSTGNYNKSATRDIRPFFDAASLEQALLSADIRLFEDKPFSDATDYTIEEQDAAKLSITVRPNLSEATLANGSVPREKLVLAITAVNTALKRTVLVHKASLSGPVPMEIKVAPEALERLGGGLRITLDAVVCLAKGAAKQPGSPFMKGHWLSKKSFEIKPPHEMEDFGVEPIGDEQWKALSMPAKTLYFVQFYGGANEPATKDKPMARVLVHEDAYNRLSDSSLKMARPIQSFLAAEIPCQILAASLSDWKDAAQPEPKSPLAAFLKQVNRVQPCTLPQLRTMVEEPGMPRLRAVLHAHQTTVRLIAEA